MNTMLDEEILRLMKKLDTVAINAAKATLEAMLSGADNLAAIEAGNAVYIAAGRKPLSVDDVLAKMDEVRHG